MIRWSIKVLPPTWQGDCSRNLRRRIRSARKIAITAQAKELALLARGLVSGGKNSGPSRPGELPKSKAGNYRRSIGYSVGRRGGFAVVGPRAPKGSHGGILKHGTKFMKPRLVPVEVAYLQSAGSRLTALFSGTL